MGSWDLQACLFYCRLKFKLSALTTFPKIRWMPMPIFYGKHCANCLWPPLCVWTSEAEDTGMEEEMARMGSLFNSWEGFFCCCFVGVFSPNKVFVALWCILMAFVFFVLADWNCHTERLTSVLCQIGHLMSKSAFCFRDVNVMLLISPGSTHNTHVLSIMELWRRHFSQEKFWWLVVPFF